MLDGVQHCLEARFGAYTSLTSYFGIYKVSIDEMLPAWTRATKIHEECSQGTLRGL